MAVIESIIESIIECVIDILFSTICGWVGHAVVKVATFGKVDMDWRKGSESTLAAWIGLCVLVFTAGLTAWFFRR